MAQKPKPKTNPRKELLAELRSLQEDFAEEAERRARLGGYSVDSGTLQALCAASTTFARVLLWLVEEMTE